MFASKDGYTSSPDAIYSKYGKIVTMFDDLKSSGCFETGYELPVYTITVVGPKQSGKDSFINYLLGVNIFPVNCPSFRPMELRVNHSSEEISPMIHIDEGNKTFTRFQDGSKYIADLQMGHTDANIGQTIRMNYTSNNCADLNIINCCELDKSKPDTYTKIREAISPSNNFIVLVMDANMFNDQQINERDDWFHLIQNYDNNLQRTMVVLTHCDKLSNNFNTNNLKKFLKESNETFNAAYGFVCVKAQYGNFVDPTQISRMEREFFCNHKFFQYFSVPDYLTLDTCGEKITKWIYSTYDFKKALVYGYQKLEERLKSVEEELSLIGSDEVDFTSQSRDLFLTNTINTLCETVEKTFTGKSEIEELNIVNTNLKKVYIDFLRDYKDKEPSKKFKNREIIDTIQKAEGCEIGGFPSDNVIYSLLDSTINELRDEMNDYWENVHLIVSQLLKSIVERYFGRFPKALTPMEELILGFMEQEFQKTKKLQEDLSEMNFSYIYIDEMSERYKEMINNCLLQGSLSDENTNQNNNNNNRNNNNNNNNNNINNNNNNNNNNNRNNNNNNNTNTGSHSSTNLPNKGNNNEKSDIKDDFKKFGNLLKTGLVSAGHTISGWGRKAAGYFGGGKKGELPPKTEEEIDLYYNGLADYVKNLVDFIFSEMVRDLREYIPKASLSFFINSLKKELRVFLIQYTVKNPEFSEGLEEDQEVTQKRKYYLDAANKLKKINKMIQYDDQITKIVKGNAIKNIDAVLQSQGITAANSINKVEEEEKKKKQEEEKKTTSLFGNAQIPGALSENKPAASSLFGVPPKEDVNKQPQQNKQPTTNNLFGNVNKNTNPQQNNPNVSKAQVNNLFGNNPQQNQQNKNTNQQQQPKNNLFGNPQQQQNQQNKSTNQQQPPKNNLFGNPQQQQNQPPKNNLFGNPVQNQQNDQNKKGPEVSLKFDSSGNVSGVGVKNMTMKDAANIYNSNKQYLPSGQQVASGAKTAANAVNNANKNNNNQKNNPSGIFDFFTKK